MSGRPFLSGRIPQDLHERIEAYCQEEYVSKTEVMIEALRKYLDCPDPVEKPSAALEVRIEELEKRLSQVEAKLTAQPEKLTENKETTGVITNDLTKPLEENGGERASQKALPLDVEEETGTDDTSGEILLRSNESKMGQASGVHRSKLKRHREKIQQGKAKQKEAIDGVIDGKVCKLYFKEKDGKSWIWEAREAQPV